MLHNLNKSQASKQIWIGNLADRPNELSFIGSAHWPGRADLSMPPLQPTRHGVVKDECRYITIQLAGYNRKSYIFCSYVVSDRIISINRGRLA